MKMERNETCEQQRGPTDGQWAITTKATKARAAQMNVRKCVCVCVCAAQQWLLLVASAKWQVAVTNGGSVAGNFATTNNW